jgi:glucose-6-phosphate isomerase
VVPTRPWGDQIAAWAVLQDACRAGGRDFDLRGAFAADPHQFEFFSQSAPHVFADLCKNLIDAATQALLFDLARQCGVEQHRDAINTTEQRAVLRYLLRKPAVASTNIEQ